MLYADESSDLLPISNCSMVYVCTQANHHKGKCYFCLCSECWNDKHEAKKRGGGGAHRNKDEKSPSAVLHLSCDHKPQNLKPVTDLWWCAPKFIGKEDWGKRVHGCVLCKKVFVLNSGSSIGKVTLPKSFKFPPLNEFDESVRMKYPAIGIKLIVD